jgi:phosphomevalonate kinase
LADVDAGSDTPSLVGKVLKWRKEKSLEGQCFSPLLFCDCIILNLFVFTLANALWVHINQLNQSLAQTFLHLSKLFEQDKENYESAVKYLSSLQPVQVILSFYFICFFLYTWT